MEKGEEDMKKIIIPANAKFKISKNDSFNTNSKSQNSKDPIQNKGLTFENAFSKVVKHVKNPVIMPNINQAPVFLGNLNEISNRVPINININNYNINNFNFIKSEREMSSNNSNSKKILSQQKVLNNFLNNNVSSGNEHNININRINHNENIFSTNKFLNRSNDKPRTKFIINKNDIVVNGSITKILPEAALKSREFKSGLNENKFTTHSGDDRQQKPSGKNSIETIEKSNKYEEKKQSRPMTKLDKKIKVYLFKLRSKPLTVMMAKMIA